MLPLPQCTQKNGLPSPSVSGTTVWASGCCHGLTN